MMKLSSSIVVFAVVTAGLTSGCGKSHVDEGTVISVIYSSDTHGKLEGCGCKKNGGGITRRAAKVEAARAEDETVLYLDAGNFLSGSTQENVVNDDAIVAAYNQMGATVVNVSERELARGIEAFRQAKQDSKFDFVSANMRYDGGSVADAYVMKKVKNANVAIVGLCGTKDVMRHDSAKLPAEVTIENPLVVAKRVIPTLSGKVDIIILLSTCGDEMDSLLAQLPDLKIDLIVGGRSYRPNTSAPWLFGPGFAKGSVGGYRDLNEQVKTAEENVRNAKGMNARGLLSGDELAKAQNELEELRKQQSGDKGEGGGHNTCVVRTARDGRELGRMDLVFGAKSVIKTYSPKTLTMDISDPSSAEMLALVRKHIPSFVDNPTAP